MKPASLEILACPCCRAPLSVDGPPTGTITSGTLTCPSCGTRYPVRDGIPHFVEAAELTGFNRRFARAYDLFSWGYRLFSRIGFAYLGLNEAAGRREITDRLEPRGGRVLEVSIGPGVNLPGLMNRADVGEVAGLDISLGQLRRCQSYTARMGWPVDLFLGNGEKLPFRDGSFGGVFHVGGINFFNDKQAAIDEMIRVAAPGTRVLIADETEQGFHEYERFFPGFKKSFRGRREPILPPVGLVPGSMRETRVFEAWKGFIYCIEFRKP